MFLVNNDTRSMDNDPYWLLIKLMLHLVVVSGEFYSFDVFIHYNAWEKASSKKIKFDCNLYKENSAEKMFLFDF